MPSKRLICIYNSAHIAPALHTLTKLAGDATLVACSLEVEFLLQKQGVAFESVSTYKRDSSAASMVRAEKEVHTMLGSPAWSFFTYRDVPLRKVSAMLLQVFLLGVFYWTDLLTDILGAHPDCEELYVPEQPVNGVSLADYRHTVFLRGAQLLSADRGIRCISFNIPRPTTTPLSSSLSGAGLTIFFFCINTCIRLLRRRKPVRILSSEMWKNISLLMPELPDVELVLLDRGELRNIGFAKALKHRMQFVHLEQFVSAATRRHARVAAAAMQEVWKHLKTTADSPRLVSGDTNISLIFIEALDAFFATDIPEAFLKVEGAYATLERIEPQLVLLRATVSRQPHFSILALVAKKLGIPALELQHGGHEYFGPGAFSAKNYSAEYMAVYGPLIRKELIALGYEGSKIFPVGSPRFDAYSKVVPAAHERFEVVCIAPSILFGGEWDEYQIRDYFTGIAQAVKNIPNVNVIIKLKPDTDRQYYHDIVKRAFDGVSHRVTEFEPLTKLFASADLVISCYSTTILEAMMCHVPVVVAALQSFEREVARVHYTQYEQVGALVVAHTPQELKEKITALALSSESRKKMATNAAAYIKEQHSFEAGASQRVSALVYTLINE